MTPLPLANSAIIHADPLPGIEAPTVLQQLLLPYLPHIERFYWAGYWGTLLFVVVRFIVLPLWQRHAKKPPEGD